VRIPGNEKADQIVKEALDEDISTTEIKTSRRPEESADRRWFQKERPKMEKRKQRDERKEVGRRQKEGYERNAKERASGNIQTQNRVYEGHPRRHGLKKEGVRNLLSATPIYSSITYCGNAKKLRTREWTWTWETNNGSTVWRRNLPPQKKSDCTTEYRNGKNNRKYLKS
jgi:hypothetical protein